MFYRPSAFLLVVVSAFFTGTQVFAADATLFISPITGQYTVNVPFSVTAGLSSGGASVNAAEGSVVFDPKEFEVVSVDLADTDITSWLEKPTVPATDTGEVRFNGWFATATPSNQNTPLTLFRLSVRPLRNGDLTLKYGEGSATAVHAADGTGGNVVAVLRSGVYAVGPEVVTPEVSPTPASASPEPEPQQTPAETNAAIPPTSGEVLGATTVTKLISSSHSDQSRWYPTTTAEFSWGNEKGMTGLLLGVGKKPVVKGSVSYKPFIDSKSIPNLQDGVWYFHITKLFANGDERTEHYRINVDTTAPTDVSLSEVERTDPTNPAVAFLVTATDTASGVDHYAFFVDGKDPEIWKDDGEHTYRLTETGPGDHKLSMDVFDAAGNKTSATATFSIKALPAPTLTARENNYAEGEKLKLDIHSVPNAKITLSIAANGGDAAIENIVADGSGDAVFTATAELLPAEYRIIAYAEDSRGAKTAASDPLTLAVRSTMLGMVKRHPMIPVALIALIVLLGVGWYVLKRFRGIDSNEVENVHYDVPVDIDETVDDVPVHMPQMQADHSVVILSEKKFTPAPKRMPITKL